ncbi:MAG: hypothetical protein D6812_05565 [Deltaproteobacteria bacterium]|nr:MAG: hypothetical protein D6812_05565 [Deltaproteobacteria bacterium]
MGGKDENGLKAPASKDGERGETMKQGMLAFCVIVSLGLFGANRCGSNEPQCDYPFEITFSDVEVGDTLGGPADFRWTTDVVNNRGEAQLEEPIVMDSAEQENPVAVVSVKEDYENDRAWFNVVPFPGVALLNDAGTQIVGGLFLMVVWPYEETQSGAVIEIGDIREELPPQAAAFLFYGPADSSGRIVCFVQLDTGSCQGEITIDDFGGDTLSAHMEGTNYPISEDEIVYLTEQGLSLCEEG